MRLSDITVEVRDKNLVRLGNIRPEELDVTIQDAFNNVGSWTLSLSVEHPMAPLLAVPGAGLIVTGPQDVLMSGPMTKVEYATTPEDPGGTVTFEGVSDSILLSDALSWPQPSNPDVTTQTVGHDDRTDNTENLLHAYVSANIGPEAPDGRRRTTLLMGENLQRGPIVTKSPRFPVLGTLLAEIALLGSLGFRVVQRGSNLFFETFAIVDRSKAIRLDVYNHTLSAQRVAITPPDITRAIVAGQGDLEDRTFVAVTNDAATSAEVEWNRRIEVFIDQRQTDDLTELGQAGDEALADSGFTKTAVQAVPLEDSSMPFGTAWNLGDLVGVVVEGQELSSVVTGWVLKANSEGFIVGALLGDTSNFDKEKAVNRRLQGLEKQVALLLSR